MVDKTQIVEFLSKGFSLTQVSQICGCSISWVSEVAETCAEEIAVTRALVTIQKQAIDNNYNLLEEAVLERLQTVLPFETNTGVLIKALQVLNGAKRRSEGETAGTSQTTVINQAVLVMPERFVRQQDRAAEIVVNGNNEIVEIEGRPLLSASANSINTMLNTQMAERLLQQRTAQAQAAEAMLHIKTGPRPEDF